MDLIDIKTKNWLFISLMLRFYGISKLPILSITLEFYHHDLIDFYTKPESIKYILNRYQYPFMLLNKAIYLSVQAD
uniref:Uncharacterized protein n=1 Tax=Onchocerca volvulus TaxID=6282 RepID=A0A8R1XYG4_ONCVO